MRIWTKVAGLVLAGGAAVAMQLAGAPHVLAQEADGVDVSVLDAGTFAEGPVGITSSRTFTIRASGFNHPARPLTVSWELRPSVANGATAGSDFTGPQGQLTGSVTYDAGQNGDRQIVASVPGDSAIELDESFELKITDARLGAFGTGIVTVSDDTGAAGITNDDFAQLRAVDVSRPEGSPTAAPAAVLAVRLDGAHPMPISVHLRTADGNGVSASGAAVAPGDYAQVSDTVLQFAPTTAATQTVQATTAVAGDERHETDESFRFILSQPSAQARIADATGLVTLVDDDVRIDVQARNFNEGDTGTTQQGFTVTRTGAIGAGRTDTVRFSVQGITAEAADFAAPATSVTFTGTQTTATARVDIVGDRSRDEGAETLRITLSGHGGIVQATATGTILQDDVPEANIASFTNGNEGGTAFVTIRLSKPIAEATTINWRTRDGSARFADGDYGSRNTSVTIPAGSQNVTVGVRINHDTDPICEFDETLFVDLLPSTGATLGPSSSVQLTIAANCF